MTEPKNTIALEKRNMTKYGAELEALRIRYEPNNPDYKGIIKAYNRALNKYYTVKKIDVNLGEYGIDKPGVDDVDEPVSVV